jgi:glycosyltransferase involved in cell wall biosynthesis
VDIVHTHDFYTNIFGIMSAAIAGVPVRIASRRECNNRSALQRRVERYAYRAAHRIVANCEHVRRRLVSEGIKPNKIVTLYNGVDLHRLRSENPPARDEILRRFGLPVSGARFVVIVANLRPVKDHRTFLKAAARLKSLREDLIFVLAGEGRMKGVLRELAFNCGLGDSVVFAGSCDRVGELLQIADVCVLSSRSEGFSNSILEYMAAARPVVATDVGGVREVVVNGQSGYIVAPGDDLAMAARILSLLDDPRRAREMGERGREIIEQRFSSEVQLQRAEQLYDNLLAVASPRARLSKEELAQEVR